MYCHYKFDILFAEALLQSRPLPHIPALPEGDPPSGTSIQSISQANVQQHSSVSSGLLEAANRSVYYSESKEQNMYHAYIITILHTLCSLTQQQSR